MELSSILLSIFFLTVSAKDYQESTIDHSEVVNTTVYRSILKGSVVHRSTLKLSRWINSRGFMLNSSYSIVKDATVSYSRLLLLDDPACEHLQPEEAFEGHRCLRFNRIEDSYITGSTVGMSMYGLSCGMESDNSTSVRSWMMETWLQGSLSTNSSLDGAYACGSVLSNSSVLNSNVTRSSITDSFLARQSNVLDSEIEGSVVKNSILIGCVIKHSKVEGKTFNNITMIHNVIVEGNDVSNEKFLVQ